MERNGVTPFRDKMEKIKDLGHLQLGWNVMFYE